MISYKGYNAVDLHVNGETREVVIKPSETLLSVLRDKIGLTGPKAGCENGDCGACTVLLEGQPVKSCLVLAVEAIGKKVVTVEGLHDTEVQKAFVEESGFQCGYCTAGFIVNSYALLEENPDADASEKVEWLSSNLCRCTGYEDIEKAVDSAQRIKNNSESR